MGKSEENKAMTEWFVNEVWNKRNITAGEKSFSPDIIVHTPTLDHHDFNGWKALVNGNYKSLSDTNLVIEKIIAEEDMVAFRWKMTATQTETNKMVTMRGGTFFQFKDGKVIQLWNYQANTEMS
jgi:predicted SnoaL-like aldol condensation-catalyzing enzyme